MISSKDTPNTEVHHTFDRIVIQLHTNRIAQVSGRLVFLYFTPAMTLTTISNYTTPIRQATTPDGKQQVSELTMVPLKVS